MEAVEGVYDQLQDDSTESYEVDDVFVKFASSFHGRSSQETTLTVFAAVLVTLMLIIIAYFYMQKQSKREQEKMREYRKGVNRIGQMKSQYENMLREAEQRYREKLRSRDSKHASETDALSVQYDQQLQKMADRLEHTKHELTCAQHEKNEVYKQLQDKETVCRELMDKQNQLGLETAALREQLKEQKKENEELKRGNKELQNRLENTVVLVNPGLWPELQF